MNTPVDSKTIISIINISIKLLKFIILDNSPVIIVSMKIKRAMIFNF